MADTTVTSEPAVLPEVSLGDEYLRSRSRLEKAIGPEWYRMLKGLVTNPLSIAGIIILIGFISMALFAPFLAPPPTAIWDTTLIPRDGFRDEPRPPGTPWERNPPETVPGWYKVITGKDEWVHIMGTTSGQYDIWYGIVWGARTALIIGAVIVTSAAIIGVLIGAVAGYYGSWVDEILMRIVEIFIAFPFLVGALILASILVPKLGRSIWPASIALIVFGWTGYARVLRGDILAIKEREYVTAARAAGAKDIHLIFRHILPNAIYSTLVILFLDMGAIVLSFAALSFLGIGVQVGYADWGQIVSHARNWIFSLDTYWYIIVFPGAALLLYSLGWNLVGDGLRDIMDPKMRKR